MVYELAEGLDYCHKHGVLHRNLKPENIMINDEGHVVITDFSLSRIINIPHGPYTPEVSQTVMSRIQKRGNDQDVKLEDCGIVHLNSYSGRECIHLR